MESKFKLDDFQLYNQAREFRKKIYQLIKQLPPFEKHCLDGQMRRAAVSISNNIAEGHGRGYYQANIHFCRTSRGSVDEIQDDLNVCLDEGYGEKQFVVNLKNEGYELIRKINSFIAYLKKTKPGGDP